MIRIIKLLLVTFAILSVVSYCAIRYGLRQADRAIDVTLNRAALTKLRHSIGDFLLVNKAFPPRITIDSATGATTSWRVLLELTAGNNLGEYDRGAPWDAPVNTRLSKQPTYVRYETQQSKGSIPVTRFVALEDPESVIGSETMVGEPDILDGIENTLLIAEVNGSEIPWSEPRDMDFQEFERASHGSDDLPDSDGNVGFKCQQLLFADLKIYHIERALPRTFFRALWTRRGRDGVSRAELIQQGYLAP